MKEKERKILLKFLNIMFIIYIAILTYLLFFSERYGRGIEHTDYRYNLTLFKELKRFITYRQEIGLEGFAVNVFGNLIAFMPYGFLLPIISPHNRKLINVSILTFIFSLTVETLQLISKVGIFDVDDLFLNTLGGIIGYVLFKAVCTIRKRFRGDS